ncbi:cadherin-99C-like isoform X2 [Vespula maculifrons]|uniref:Cadherin-99C-like isoform X2 n=1 Tax=Vespula maculifrons TaxID=7453 RepID=A0ABD2C0L9_VESMC
MNLAKGRRIGNSSDGEVELNIAIVERDGRRKRDCNGLNESDKTARTGKQRSFKLEFIRSASSNLTPVLTKLTATVAVQQPSKSYSDSVVELIKQPVGRPAALAVTPSFSFAGYTLALKRSSTAPPGWFWCLLCVFLRFHGVASKAGKPIFFSTLLGTIKLQVFPQAVRKIALSRRQRLYGSLNSVRVEVVALGSITPLTSRFDLAFVDVYCTTSKKILDRVEKRRRHVRVHEFSWLFQWWTTVKKGWLKRTYKKCPGLCEVESGQSNIILDIEESRGNAIDQKTTPEELPVSGDPYNETTLELIFPGRQPLFKLIGKKLQLLEPLDRDDENLSHVVFQLSCTVKLTNKKRTIPVIVRVSDINDNAPKFINTPYETTVPELTPVGSTIFKNVVAIDADAGVNGIVEYSIAPGDGTGIGNNDGVGRNRITTADGYGYFSINLPHQGQVTVNRTLDFERTQRYLVTILASDRALNVSERFTSTTTLTVNIRDDDDQDPSFIYQGCMLLDGACINPEYSASVSSGVLSGILNISPEKIQAVDMDSINAPIHYSFLSGNPSNYRDFFEINPNSGAVKQIKAVDTSVTKKFDIIIKAVEVSEAKRSATAKLIITVKPVDSNPPVITASNNEGFVDENAPVGTKVIDKNGKPITLTVSDADLGVDDPKPAYTFELTTSYFSIDPSGVLIVNEENLDRDPPNPGRFRFQVVAREKTGLAASAPLSFVVTLNDVNDNAPHLPMTAPISVQAGETRRQVTKVEATDNDEGENAEITYGIYHVSNNGLHKFKIDPKTGVIESVRKLNAGEQYSITVQATDKGGKYSQTIVEVNVIPGPNTRSPVFQQPVYEVQVSEGASINSTVATITAVDPENDPVSYSIVSGNDLRQFAIGDKSGVITVIRKLDREDLTRYQLLIKAEDTGGLSSTATVNIKVTDINDKNPEFVELPYQFSVKEGEARKLIGRVHAEDADEGINAEITYFAPDDIPFTVDPETGDVLTKIVLDYEQNDEYKFVVTARDGAPDYRLATATVTVKVIDVEDEVPIFRQSSYEARVKENVPDYMVIQVMADDPDTKKQITYTIKQGDTELFAIDPKNGVIKTIRGLDYERENQHILIVGTVENTSDLPGSTTRVVVNVQDVNDIPPIFTMVPRPITLDDDSPIGTTVINLVAADSDGTAPGNQVRYEIIGRGIASKYFVIDPDTGVIRIRDDLRKETDSEYQVDVRAYDMGEPRLSSVTTVPIFVRHVATVPPEVGLGFAENSYNVEVPEDAADGTLIKIITIINSHAHDSTPLKCEIYSGNENDLFEANVTEERNCALKLKKAALDYETTEFYQIKIRLESLSGLLNSGRNTTMVKIQVIDVNDNKPEFIFPEDDYKLRRGRYFAAIPRNAQFGSSVIQVKAHDKDNGKYGKLEYKILEGRGSDYFAMDAFSGIIRTTATFDNVDPSELPFKFDVNVRDNPNSTTNFNSIVAPVIVNLIGEENLLILVIQDAAPEVLQKDARRMANIIEEKSGLLVGIDRIAVRKVRTKNGTVETYPQDSDVWFYAIDPDTELILDRNSSRIQRSIVERTAVSNITFDVSTLVRANAIDIHAPVMYAEPVRTQTAVAFSGEVFPYALIIIACVILILGIAGIIYISVSWSRYKAYKERMQRMYVVPRYDPVYVEPNLKEYETQVLQMSVPVDDNDSYNDLQLDFSNKNHAFSLDNVSYITKDHGGSTGQQSPVSSEAATTARASSIAGNHAEGNVHSLRRSTLGRKNHTTSNSNTMNNHDTTTPVLNPLYNHGGDLLSASPSNDNVTFREKKDYSHLGFTYLYEQSPVETTTEL